MSERAASEDVANQGELPEGEGRGADSPGASGGASPEASAEFDRQFAALLEYIKHSRGFDFTGYKRPSLERRIRKRMQALGIEGFEAYIDYLEVHPLEFTTLFNTVLINVTGFFRDPASWQYLREEIVPRILEAKVPNDQVRAWCAGTASGEEAYTVAMVLCEAVGEEAFRERVKIYATDVDEEALAYARQGAYGERALAEVPPEIVEKYFERNGGSYLFRKDLRRSVIFGRHDLVQDAPISRIDLLVCRNTLMYFNTEAQGRILTRFHFALGDQGYLFLGRAEMLFTHTGLFTPVNLKYRVFTKVPRLNLRDRLLVLAQNGDNDAADHLTRHVRFREAAFENGATAQVAVDANGFLGLANERARALFGLTGRDLGRALPDLEFSYRLPGLRAAVEQAYAERRPNQLKDVKWATPAGDVRYLEVFVVPLIDSTGLRLGVTVTVADITQYEELQGELEHTNQELETAYEELQSTNEELETTNEELQSTVEELETTNEELQSTNEELETMNEELQSLNEELQTVNDELRGRTDELNRANGFLESILDSMVAGVAVLNRDLRVITWNRTAEDQWGLRSGEAVGQHFMSLDIGLPVEQLRQAIRACLAGESGHEEITVQATNRRGRRDHYQVIITPLAGRDRNTTGVIVSTEEHEA